MKVVKASNGKKTIKISKSEWEKIGREQKWFKTAAYKAGEYIINNNTKKDFLKQYAPGEAFDDAPMDQTTKVEVWFSSFNDEGEDYTEFRFYNGDNLIYTKRIKGY